MEGNASLRIVPDLRAAFSRLPVNLSLRSVCPGLAVNSIGYCRLKASKSLRAVRLRLLVAMKGEVAGRRWAMLLPSRLLRSRAMAAKTISAEHTEACMRDNYCSPCSHRRVIFREKRKPRLNRARDELNYYARTQETVPSLEYNACVVQRRHCARLRKFQGQPKSGYVKVGRKQRRRHE